MTLKPSMTSMLSSHLEDGRYIFWSEPHDFRYVIEKHSDGVPKEKMLTYLRITFGFANEELKIIAFTKDGPIFARKS